MMESVGRALRTLIMRGTLKRTDDSKGLQQMQVSRLEGEVLECERVGQWGLTSVPPSGSEVVIVQIGSSPDHHVILGVDDSGRPHPNDPGSTMLYDGQGSKVFLAGDGSIQINASIVYINAGTVVLSGNLVVEGSVNIGGLLNGHAP